MAKETLTEQDIALALRALRALRVTALRDRDLAIASRHETMAASHNFTQRECQDLHVKLSRMQDADEGMVFPAQLCIGDKLHWSHVEVLSAPIVSVIVRNEESEIETREWAADATIPAPIRPTATADTEGK